MLRSRFAFIWMWLLMPYTHFAQSLAVYPAPAGIAPSPYFSVRVRIGQQPWQPVFTHHSINSLDSLGGLSIGIFSFTGPIELEITPSGQPGSIANVAVRPKPYGIAPRLADGKILSSASQTGQFCRRSEPVRRSEWCSSGVTDFSLPHRAQRTQSYRQRGGLFRSGRASNRGCLSTDE